MPARRIRLLIADDEAGFRETMKERFEHRGFEVHAAPDAETALGLLSRESFDVALFDIRMPGMDGLTLLQLARDRWPFLEVIIVTGQGSIEAAITAMKRGASGFLTKPVRTAELDVTIEKALEHGALTRDRRVKEEVLHHLSSPEDFIYAAAGMKSLVETAERVAPSDATILIEGESGTGKEVLAHFLHRRSRRSEGPFIVVDCGTLSDQLLERELFGHQRGAYTGADETRPGLVTIAEGGTLLIDEIGHISPAVQAKLLRLIERNTYRRLGDPAEIRADVRILAATNQDLEALSKKGTFREDLFHRLNVLRFRIPPLRQRPEDIRLLSQYFLSRHSPLRNHPKTLAPDAEAALVSYGWPGNIRELGNVLQRACLITPGPVIEAGDLGIDTDAPPTSNPLSLHNAEKRHIEAVLSGARGDKALAAEQLGITLRHLYRKLLKHGLNGGF